jgi:diguanylate cyclase (GGDEF)-like protein
VIIAGSGYAAILVLFVLVERPGLGIGHLYYLPICLIALATDELGGVIAAVVGALLYTLGVVLDPRIPSRDALTTSTGIRILTFAIVGAVIGHYARRNRQLVERLRDHALRDFVTGVGNMRAFDEELGRRCAGDEHFSLVLLDVDELRRVNEVHGHLAGDAALRKVAAAVTRIAGSTGVVARVGGDEFALVTPLPPEHHLLQVAERLNAILAADDLSITAAATAFPADGETADDLFRKADDRLFAAKLVRTNRRTLAAV